MRFWVILLTDRQTDKRTRAKHLPPLLSEVIIIIASYVIYTVRINNIEIGLWEWWQWRRWWWFSGAGSHGNNTSRLPSSTGALRHLRRYHDISNEWRHRWFSIQSQLDAGLDDTFRWKSRLWAQRRRVDAGAATGPGWRPSVWHAYQVRWNFHACLSCA